ncbi:hypothetical protein N9H78_03585 [Winogradskyella sp.]|nr:hypothetical protein [Winogradskyella sp.]MDA8874735.1 hypothetical protein [Winogradskyella sp.]
MNCNRSFYDGLIKNNFVKKNFDSDTINFLENSYHSEYLSLMFSQKYSGVDIFSKKINYEIGIDRRHNHVTMTNIDMYIFSNSYKNTKTSIFSITYKPSDLSLGEISNISNDLKNHDCEIIFDSDKLLLKEFITKYLFFGNQFSETNTSLDQYSGFRFKNYLVIDFDDSSVDRNNLLYELGTSSMLGTIEDNTIHAPSYSYLNHILKNKISCFKNYECLTLLDSFTVIGTNNYDKGHIYTHTTWNDIYFSIYIFNLYIKCSVQIILDDFTSDAMTKRKEFQEFYNKYYFRKISYNFLPNEIFKRISDSLEIDDDLDYLDNKLETLASQVNEKQQKQQEFLLLCISVIALLETPLHIEGIREIIGIRNMVIYNSLVYPTLILAIVILLMSRYRRK